MAKILKDPNDHTALPPIGNDPEYIDPDVVTYGYRRELSEELIGVGALAQPIPVLAGIGEIQALPAIVDPVIERYFAEFERQGPRLLACNKNMKDPRAALILCAEFPPARILSRIADAYYEIYMPYLIAAYKPGGAALWLTCRSAPVTPDDQTLYRFPFPHVRDNELVGDICIYIEPPSLAMEPLAQISEAVRQFQHTGYFFFYSNPHLPTLAKGPAVKAYNDGDFLGHDEQRAQATKVFKWWEKLTQADVLNFKYESTKLTVQDWVPQAQGNYPRYPITYLLEP